MLSPRGKKELKINQRRILINSIEIGIPAPEQVFILGQRHTSNGKMVGRVRNSKTLNYKSFTPHRDGLFCERIFGPVQSYICACGKQGPLTTSKGILKFCPRCEVEYTDQRARRYRVGYIGLVSPVTHIWHLKGRPSYLSLFLGKRKKTLATLAYCNDYLVEQAFSKIVVNGLLRSTKQHHAELSCSGVRSTPEHAYRPARNDGATFFKNRILKGLKESKVIKGFTVSREQEKSKVWSSESYFIDGSSANPPRSRGQKGHLFAERVCLPLRSYGKQTKILASQKLELREVEEFDNQNRKCTSFLKSLRQLSLTLSRSDNFCEPAGTRALGCSAPQSKKVRVRSSSSPKGSLHRFPPSSAQVKREVSEPPWEVYGSTERQQRDTLSYTRSHTLPFLPTFICEFHLRDGLLSFFDTFPPSEDIPIPVYCTIPRRYPLRDVHKFMADQAFSKVQLLPPFWGQPEVRSGNSQNTVDAEKSQARRSLSARAELLLSPMGLKPKVRDGANANSWQTKNKSLLDTVNLNSKIPVVPDSSQLCLPPQEIGLIDRPLCPSVTPKRGVKDVSHTLIGTINDKKLYTPFSLSLRESVSPANRAEALLRRASRSWVTPLREVLLTLLLGRVVTTLIGYTPILTTCLNRPELPMSKSKVLVGAKPRVVMSRRVGSQLPLRTSVNLQNGFRDLAKVCNSSEARVTRVQKGVPIRYFAAQSKKGSTTVSETIVRPARKKGERNSLRLLSTRRELSLRSLLRSRKSVSSRVSRQTKTSLSKSQIVRQDLQLKHASGSWLPVIGKSPAHLKIRLVFRDGWSNLGSLSQAWLANPYRSWNGVRLGVDATTAGQDRNAPFFWNREYFRAIAPSLSTGSLSCSGLLRSPEHAYWRSHFLALGCSAPQSTHTGHTFAEQKQAKVNERKSKAVTFAKRKFDLRYRIVEPVHPKVEQTSNQVLFEDSFFSLRLWARQKRTLGALLPFGESVEEWLEYWFDRWLQNHDGVHRNAPLFVHCKYAQEVSQTLHSKVKRYDWSEVISKPEALKGLSLLGKIAKQRATVFNRFIGPMRFCLDSKGPSKSSANRNVVPSRPSESSPNQIGEQFLFKASNPILSSIGQQCCALKGPLLLLALRRYALGLTGQPKGKTSFFSHSQTTNIEIQLFLPKRNHTGVRHVQPRRYTNSNLNLHFCEAKVSEAKNSLAKVRGARVYVLGRAQLDSEHGQVERDSDQNTISLERLTSLKGGSEARFKLSRGQTLLRKVTKSNEYERRSVGPKHNIACSLSKHEPRVNWSKRGVFSSNRENDREINCSHLSTQPAGSETKRPSVGSVGLLNSSAAALTETSFRLGRASCLESIAETTFQLPCFPPSGPSKSSAHELTLSRDRESERSERYRFAKLPLLRSGYSSPLALRASVRARRASHPKGPLSLRSLLLRKSVSALGSPRGTNSKLRLRNTNFLAQAKLAHVPTTFALLTFASQKCKFAIQEERPSSETQSGLLFPRRGNQALRASKSKKGGQSIVNLDSQVWLPKIVTLFQILGPKSELIVAPQFNTETRFRFGVLTPRVNGEGPLEAQKQNPNTKKLIFTGSGNPKDSIADPITLYESDGQTSQSVEEAISFVHFLALGCGAPQSTRTGHAFAPQKQAKVPTLSERTSGWLRKVHLKNKVEHAASLTNPRFVSAGSSWARRLLERYRNTDLGSSIAPVRQFNKNANSLFPSGFRFAKVCHFSFAKVTRVLGTTERQFREAIPFAPLTFARSRKCKFVREARVTANRSVVPGAEAGSETTFQHSAFAQAPFELPNQKGDAQTKPDVFFSNEEAYRDEEAPVLPSFGSNQKSVPASIDDEPEIHRKLCTPEIGSTRNVVAAISQGENSRSAKVRARSSSDGTTFAPRKFGPQLALTLLRSKSERSESERSGSSGSPRHLFKTDSLSGQASKTQLQQVEHNTTANFRETKVAATREKFEFTGKVGTDSYLKAQLDLQAIQEVLSYTGGGALKELLRCFDTHTFSVILLNEIKLLREYHKGYFLYKYDQVSRQAQTRAKLESLPLELSDPTEHANSNSNLNFHEAKASKAKVRGARVAQQKASLTLSCLEPKAPSKKVRARDFVNTAWSSKAKDIEIHNTSPLWSTETKFRQAEDENNYEELPEEMNRFSRAIHRNARRLKIVQLLMRNKRRPEWMLISALPVLPPDLRPILQMSENLIVASDLNTLYQRVIYRNNRQYKLRIVEWSYATSLQRLVQDAVDRLIENGKGGSKPFLTPGGRPLKSLSDTLKGKKGRFRLNLLGKRVDFSGRSVIVVSPYLKIHECGLPREMALELYQYLLIRQMLLKRQVSSVILAKRVIRQQKAFVWDTLRELIYHHPLLLNRAPTLHRLGIQAFQPKLVLGSTILLHPLVCAGFNADFDGDQMGVHIPLCDEARAEAWDLLWSRNNLLSPATGEPILLPSQDMVLGFYHMTALLPSRHATSTTHTVDARTFAKRKLSLRESEARAIMRSADKTGRRRSYGFVQIAHCLEEVITPTHVRTPLLSFPLALRSQPKVKEEKGLGKCQFFSPLDVVRAYQNGDLDIHTPIWLQWNGKIENNDSDQTPLELRINCFGVSTQLYPSYKYRQDASSKLIATFNLFIRTTPGRVIVNNMFLSRPN